MPTANTHLAKTACERCGAALALDRAGAWVCSFQCTFCSACNSAVLHGTCPNCGGELLPRPRRAARQAGPLASSDTLRSSFDCAGNDLRCAMIGPDAVPQVAPLFDLYRQFYGQPPDLALARQFLSERLSAGQSVLMLATLAEQPVGFTQLYPIYSSVRARSAWLLNDLFVLPQERRQGVASALLRAAESYARAQGAAWLSLATAHDNHAAQALYRGLGWQCERDFLHYQRELDQP